MQGYLTLRSTIQWLSTALVLLYKHAQHARLEVKRQHTNLQRFIPCDSTVLFARAVMAFQPGPGHCYNACMCTGHGKRDTQHPWAYTRPNIKRLWPAVPASASLPHAHHLPKPESVVSRATGHLPPVRAPGHTVDIGPVPFHGSHLHAAGRIPQLNCFVVPAARHLPPIRAPRHTVDVPIMALQDRAAAATRHIPNADRPVI